MDRSDDNYTAILRNVRKARRVWNRLGKLLLREGSEPHMSTMFRLVVVQTVVLFGEEPWVLSEAMSRKMEGVHVGFLRQITGQRVLQQEDGTWRQVTAEKVLEKAGS